MAVDEEGGAIVYLVVRETVARKPHHEVRKAIAVDVAYGMDVVCTCASVPHERIADGEDRRAFKLVEKMSPREIPPAVDHGDAPGPRLAWAWLTLVDDAEVSQAIAVDVAHGLRLPNLKTML